MSKSIQRGGILCLVLLLIVGACGMQHGAKGLSGVTSLGLYDTYLPQNSAISAKGRTPSQAITRAYRNNAFFQLMQVTYRGQVLVSWQDYHAYTLRELNAQAPVEFLHRVDETTLYVVYEMVHEDGTSYYAYIFLA